MLKFKIKKYKPVSIYLNPKSSQLTLKGVLGFAEVPLPINNKIEINKNLNFLKLICSNKGEFFSFYKVFFKSFVGVSFGWSLRFEVLGRGYFVNSYKNLLFFNLGFSHSICLLLPTNIKCKVDSSKKTKFVLFGSDFRELKTLSFEIKNLRKMNAYKQNGIKFEDEIIKLKPGKQGNN